MKRWGCLLLCLLFVSCSAPSEAPGPTTREEPETAVSGPETAVESPLLNQEEAAGVPFQYGRQFLSAPGQGFYDQLYHMLSDFWIGGIEIPADIGKEEAETLLAYLMDDNPGFYWVSLDLSPQDERGVRTVTVAPIEGLTAQEARERQEEIDQIIEALTEGLDEYDDMDRLDWAHQRLGRHMSYNQWSGLDDATNIYGGLVLRSGICDAYSKSLQYLLQQMGLDCIYISGHSDRGIPHSWNAVRLRGSWYYIDPTWNDRVRIRHDYYMVSLEEMEREHYWDSTQYPALPPTVTNELDYYSYYAYCMVPDGDREGEIQQMAESFARQLADRTGSYDSTRTMFLEIKVLGTQEEYERVRELFIQELFEVLGRMKVLLAEERPDLQINTHEEVSCNFNDAMRILTLFPEVQPAE